ncbi:MAG TPA: PLP-dependent aminotransferase family protein [Acidimicrobiia bacterium]
MSRRSINPWHLVEMLGEWSSGEGPLYRRLADALARCIDHGDLRPGVRLPAERAMASLFNLSRTTVVAALDLLKTRGYLDSSPGSGTWVRAVRGFSPAGGIVTPADTVGRNPLFSRLGAGDDSMIDFTASVLSPSPLVETAIRSASREIGDEIEGAGYHPAGLPVLRDQVAEWFTGRGVPTEANQVLITSGGQQAIMLIAAAHIQPGDPVVVESPTYPGALDAFRLVGAAIRTVPVGPNGTRSRDVLQAAEARTPILTYLIPSFHNPTGTVMDPFERRRLARRLEEHTSLVVEDESLVELPLQEMEVPRPLAAHLDGVLTVGSASKPYWGGLRVGWVRGPVDLIRRLTHYKTVFDLATPVTTQAVVSRLLRQSEELLEERRRQLGMQLEAIITALETLLPEWEWTRPAGGLSVWASLPHGSATEFAQVAMRNGLAVVAGPFFDPHSQHDRYLRLPFVLPPQKIQLGVERLAAAWEHYTGRPGIAVHRPA